VKVRIIKLFNGIPSLSLIRTRSERTAVLPLPAPALTKMFLPSSVIASHCSSVHNESSGF